MLCNYAAKSPPAFFSKNYANTDSLNAGGITASSGSAFVARAISMSKGTYWTSQGSSEGATETYTIAFYEGTGALSRVIDFVGLFQTNIKTGTIVGKLAGATVFTYTITNNTLPNIIYTVASPVTIDTLIISATNVQSPGTTAEKQITAIVAAALAFQPARGMASYKPTYTDTVNVLKLGDGTKDYTQIYRSDGSFSLWSADITFKGIATADRNSFQSLRMNPDPFIFWPQPGEVPEDVFNCHIVPSSFSDPYLDISAQDAGYEITLKVEDVGSS